MAQRYLVCEGERGSVDVRLLNAVLAQYHGLQLIVEPGGGGNSPRIVRAWLERRVPGDVAFLVHDRDYGPLADAEAGWAAPEAKCLLWRCHEIENHLIEPWILQVAFDEYRESLVGEAWTELLPEDEAAVFSLLKEAASGLLTDHIGRTVCGALRRAKEAMGNTEINVPRIDPIAGTSEQWRAGLNAQVAGLRATCAAVGNAAAFDPAGVDGHWATVEAHVRTTTFLDDGHFLREMKGKRLLNQLWVRLRGRRYPGSEDDFTTDLIAAVRRAYGSAPHRRLADFENLAVRIRAT